MSWRIGELLIRRKLITWEQLEEVLEEQKTTKELTGQMLVRKGYITEALLYKALADQCHIRFVDLKRTKINPEAVDIVPGDFAKKYGIMPIEFREGKLTLGIPNPLHMWPEADLRQTARIQEIQIVLCLPGDLEEYLKKYYN